MRIINKKEFYELPKGTLYSEYEPCIFNGLFIKYNTCYRDEEPTDYFELTLVGNIDSNDSDDLFDKLFSAEEKGTEIKVDYETLDRNGLYNEDQIYAVYEKEDIEGLINILKEAIPYND